MWGKAKILSFHCCYCRTELNESQIFEFREEIGCENCIRNYYRDRPAEVELQLERRRKSAIAWLKKNRGALKRQAAKQTA